MQPIRTDIGQRLAKRKSKQVWELTGSHQCGCNSGDTFSRSDIGELDRTGLRRLNDSGDDSERRKQIVKIELVIAAILPA
jgi:hypothetical protein